MSGNDGWCTIESDPGVFTELIENMGVKDVQVEELYSLDASEFSKLKPVYGLVFLFKWDGKHYSSSQEPCDNQELFFAKQVINNACATQAILSILMNNKDIEMSDELTNFKDFCKFLMPEDRGDAIGNCDAIKRAHNSFARPESFDFESKGGKKEDAFHFVSYIPFEGKLYELDGLSRGPICHGECDDETWLELVQPIIQQRIAKYTSDEIRFNLMAVVKNRKKILSNQKNYLEGKKNAILLKLSQFDTAVTAMDIDESAFIKYNLPTTKEELDLLLAEMDEHLETIDQNIMMEDEKFRNWREENIRRKHNYIPFIIKLLQILAERQELIPLINKAKAATASVDSQQRKK
ncbi:peptidase C12 family protein [Cavenderia fasciculata]|uniref:Ubiquitin carboxyl-terminal hydrolase n=1 Tax=Cavenderia fasciculata TaxID=261658 RepID=F4PRH4_CACFS|nr:peptidase C12 family protein [Cavenderia fasciculata]EGG20526.1 peptidase C12 family protein [Cavenderia fasciculata]|eukprot:XP_004358376.1 peptidase C12 family protein [Cavenderia fasciculata]